MRRLTKRPKPPPLVANEQPWTDQYVAATSQNRRKYERWGHAEIRAILSDETDSKCAYCESTIGHVGYPNVEHIVPKSKHPELAHRWSNLTSACTRCNVAKLDYFELGMTVLNPYEDDVETRLAFWGDFIDWQIGDDRGEITVLKLELNRQDLVHERVKRLRRMQELFLRWHEASGPRKDVIAEAIRLDMWLGEYTRAVHAYLSFKHFPGVDPPGSAAHPHNRYPS